MLIKKDFTFKSPSGFIVVDGVNGAGKGTLINRLSQYLLSLDLNPLSTREPGGSELGEKLRPLILGENCAGSFTELFLFAADRAEHVAAKIKPALAAKQFVISDRYYYSTVAFQGYGRKLSLQQVNYVNALAVADCYPDLFILLDLDPEIGLARAKSRASKEQDKMEAEELDFHTSLRQGFIELAQTCQEPCLLVDALQSPEAVWEDIKPVIDNLIASWKMTRN
ncbi:MAG: dTMP kinase [Bdellovibrionota bacterium]|jgi:dTMP kinase